MYITSQILVCIADIFYVLSMLSKKKINLLVLLIISDVLFAAHYFLLAGGLAGGTTILLDAVFLVVIYILEKKEKMQYNKIATIIASCLTIMLSLIAWEGALSLLPMFAMLSYFATICFKNMAIVKIGAILRNLFNTIYLFLIASYFGGGLGIMLIISAIVGAILSYKTNKKENLIIKENNQEESSQI